MASKNRSRARRTKRQGTGKAKSARKVGARQSRRTSKARSIPLSQLSERSYAARDRALHALADMRQNPTLSLAHAARQQNVKPETILKYFPSALKKARGTFRAKKSDRYTATLYIPDAQGNHIPVTTRSSKNREALSRYLHDLGRYLRGDRRALSAWKGKRIAGVKLVTDPRAIMAMEPALSDFSLYRTFQGGVA